MKTFTNVAIYSNLHLVYKIFKKSTYIKFLSAQSIPNLNHFTFIKPINGPNRVAICTNFSPKILDAHHYVIGDQQHLTNPKHKFLIPAGGIGGSPARKLQSLMNSPTSLI